jgi:hypothetical protein
MMKSPATALRHGGVEKRFVFTTLFQFIFIGEESRATPVIVVAYCCAQWVRFYYNPLQRFCYNPLQHVTA